MSYLNYVFWFINHFFDFDDLAGINRVELYKDLKVLDLQTLPS